MDWKEALRARLLAAGDVTDLAGTRVTWVKRPQGKTLPAVTLQTIDDQRPQHLQGFDTLMPVVVQIDCWAKTDKDASDLGEAVLAALIPNEESNGWRWGRGMLERKADLGEQTDTEFINRVSMDLKLHRTTA